ncbi:MAG: type IV pilus assembly protein PilM [Deltaproteobacteria bacterium]|nr:type IV pilus assembly protein PilM [Deltaproteobacteria bacterium]
MELPFLKKKEVMALDIGSSSIKLLQLRQAKKGWELAKLGIAYLPPEAIVDGSIIDSMTVTNTIAALVKEENVKTKDAVSSLTGHSVIIKKVSLPAMTEEELGESIQWEAEQYIPFPMTDVNIDFQIMGEVAAGKGQMDVMLVAVKKDVINDYVNVIREAGLNPVVVDVDSFALENMLEINYTFAPGENVVMVNIGASITSISILVGGVTAFTRSIPLGGNQFTEEIQRNFNITFKEAEDIKLGHVKGRFEQSELNKALGSVSSNVAAEVKRSVDFFLGGNPAVIVNKIFLSGGGVKVAGLKETVQEKMDMIVEVANPFNGITCNPKVFDPEKMKDLAPHFGVAVGLATRKLGDR